MVREEITALLRTAHDQLLRAEDAFGKGFYDSCALFSALAAENSAAALILALGSKPSKKHRNWYVLQIIPKPKELAQVVNGVLMKLKTVEEHIVRARYPVKDEEGTFIVPSEYYNKPKAEELFQNSKNAVARIETIVKTIVEKEKK